MSLGRAPLVPPGPAAFLVALAAAAMCFLAQFALGAGIGAARLAGAWQDQLGAAAILAIPAPETGAAPVDAALLTLRGTPGVASVSVVPAAEAAEAARLWLGGLDPGTLPMPTLIEIEPGPGFDAQALRFALAQAVPGALLDDMAAWRGPLAALAERLRLMVWAAAGLAALALGAVVAASAQAALRAGWPAARALRLMGGPDRRIAAAFDRAIALRALIGGALGAATAALGLLALPAPDFGPAASLSLPLWPALALPPLAGLLALLAARLSILRALARAEG